MAKVNLGRVVGKSAYEIWLDEGNQGTEQDFLDSLKGQDGADGINGRDGRDGTNGQDGFSPVASVQQTSTGAIVSVTDRDGTTSAELRNGIDGTDGTNGQDGQDGQDGYTPVRGTDYWTSEDIAQIEGHCDDYVDGIVEDLEERVEDLENNQIQGTASGTSIDLSDSASSRVKSIDINGNSVQFTTTGAQLLDFGGNAITSASTYNFANDNLSITSTSGTYNAIFYDILDLVKANGGKSINFGYDNVSRTGEAPYSFRFAYVYEGESTTRYHNIVTSGAFDIPSDTTVFASFALAIYQNNSSTSNPGTLMIEKPMLYFGTTKPDYEPYTKGASPNPNYPQEVNSSGDNGYIVEKFVNKNLLKLEELHMITNTQGVIENTTIHRSVLINVSKINSLCITGNFSYLESTLIRVGLFYEYPFIGLQGTRTSATQNNNVIDTTDYNYILLTFVRASNITYEDIEKSFQIEQGSTATDYEQHQSQTYTTPCQQPMRAIGNVKDTFVKIDGVWYERHNIGEFIANNNLLGNGITDDRVNLRTPTLNIAVNLGGDAFKSKAMCNLLQKTINNNTGLAGTTSTGEIRVVLSKDYVTTYAEANTYLTEKGLKIYWAMEEPIDLPCTQAQITALEALMKARTYKKITHIYSEDSVPAEVDLTYYKDTQTYLDNIITRLEVLESEV